METKLQQDGEVGLSDMNRDRMLDVIEKEYEIKEKSLELQNREIELKKQEDKNAYDFAMKSIEVKKENDRHKREVDSANIRLKLETEQKEKSRNSYIFFCLVIAIIFLIIFSLLRGQVDFASEVLKSVILFFSGAAGGGGLVYYKFVPKQQND